MANSELRQISAHRCFGGEQRFYQHDSALIGLPMRFSVYLPPTSSLVSSAGSPADSPAAGVPVLFYLAGLTCTEETFMIKGGAQQWAAAHNIMLVAPDTSPRGAGIQGESDAWDFGVGAGFYLDATQEPWNKHYRMESYLTQELYPLVMNLLGGDRTRVGIFGHSMGGHGALTLALRHRALFQTVSAFAPICAPSQCPWGQKAFGGYLGNSEADRAQWLQHDAAALLRSVVKTKQVSPYSNGILVDQGLKDQFLSQLCPEELEKACAEAGQELTLRRHEGYDHGYYFVSTFMKDHIEHHARVLCR